MVVEISIEVLKEVLVSGILNYASTHFPKKINKHFSRQPKICKANLHNEKRSSERLSQHWKSASTESSNEHQETTKKIFVKIQFCRLQQLTASEAT